MMHGFVAIGWLIALAWLYKLVEAASGLSRVPNLAQAKYEAAPVATPTLAVIVPARNEEKGVRDCIVSLLKQNYEKLRVIAVDDRSTDGTGAMMDELAAGAGGRLQILHIDALPSGWLGKTHAMARAAREAMDRYGVDYLLFTDGDVIFAPEAVRRSLAYVVEAQADHFVLMPTTLARSVGESAVLSFLQAMSLWALRPWRVSDPAAKRDAIGVGAFNLVRATAYRQIGGFEFAPMEILEDLYLGRRIKWAGLRQAVATGPGLVEIHWAAGARGIIRGMTKNIFAVFRFRPLPLVAAAGWVLLFAVGPVLCLAFSSTRLAGGVALAAIFGIYVLSARTSRISPMYALFMPLAAPAVVYAMLRSMAVTLWNGGVVWRGTFYGLEELRREMIQGNGARRSRRDGLG